MARSRKSKLHTTPAVRRALIIPDTHVPFEDKQAYSMMLNVAEDVQPEEIVILGDFGDFYSINSHGVDARLRHLNLVDEIAAVNDRLDELDELFPEARKVFIAGNHEHRLARYINNKAPELIGMAEVDHLFSLHTRRNWKFVPYGPTQLYQVLGSHLFARHEPLSGSAHAAYQTVVKAGCSVVFGHIHRIQEYQVVMMDGKNHRGISVGWLGDETHHVMEYVGGHHQWAKGFGVVDVLRDGTFFHQTVHIIGGKCSYGGMVYGLGEE